MQSGIGKATSSATNARDAAVTVFLRLQFLVFALSLDEPEISSLMIRWLKPNAVTVSELAFKFTQ